MLNSKLFSKKHIIIPINVSILILIKSVVLEKKLLY